MPAMGNNEYRRKLIVRVEALRKDAGLTKLSFRQQIGPVAARCWASFVSANDEDAWNHFSFKTIDRISKVFGIGDGDLLSFRSLDDADRP
jgi:hypothetical protein